MLRKCLFGKNARWLLITAHGLFGLACGDLSPVRSDGTCGNQLVEPASGEDCDKDSNLPGVQCGLPGTRQACRFDCSQVGQVGCPRSWSCGLDGICRIGTDRFDEPRSLNLGISTPKLADITGDGLPEVLLAQPSAISVLIGDSEARYFRASQIELRRNPNRAALGRLDEGEALDLVLSDDRSVTPFLGRRSGTVLPALNTEPLGESTTAIFLVSMRRRGSGQRLFLRLNPTSEEPVEIAGAGTVVLDEVRSLFEQVDADLLGEINGRLPVANLQVDEPDDPTYAQELAFAWPSEPKVGLLSVACSEVLDCQVSLAGTVTLKNGPSTSSVALALRDFNGDGFVDLGAVVRSNETSLEFYAAFGDGTGLLESPSGEAWVAEPIPLVDEFGESLLSGVNDDERYVLYFSDWNEDGIADWMTVKGLYVVTSTAPWRVQNVASSEPGLAWTNGVAADFNGDGLEDYAVALPSPIDELIIRVRSSEPNGYVERRVPKIVNPKSLTPLDADGDGLVDLALITGNEVQVLYMRAGGIPDQVVVQAEVDNPRFLEGWSYADEKGFHAELRGIAKFGSTEQAEFRLVGHGERQLTSPIYFDFVRAAGIGQVSPASGAGEVEEIVVVDQTGPIEEGRASLFVLKRDPVKRRWLYLDSPAEIYGATDIFTATTTTFSGLMDTDGDGLDEVLFQSIFSDPDTGALSGFSITRLRDGYLEELGALSVDQPLQSVECGDLDQDGLQDLVFTAYSNYQGSDDVLFGLADSEGSTRTLQDAGTLIVWWGGPSGEFDSSRSARFSYERLRSATLMGTELAVFLERPDDPVEVLRFDPLRQATFGALELQAFITPGGGQAMVAEDLDGDGLIDLLLSGTDANDLYLRQPCTPFERSFGSCGP